ncbi:uncharacterized protein [Nicotiana sylvestris]|uniref:uncharacterized protein n=1 Tax=Nicotiana sylvestris TaxID=4096 RepID=UPI00388C8B74
MKRKIDSEKREPKKENNLVLKAESNDSSEENSDMAYLIKRLQKMVRRNGGILKRDNFSKPNNYDLCYKCGKPGNSIKYCPLMNQEHSKYNLEKVAKRNLAPDKHFKRKRSTDNVVKQALAAWGDSSSESEDETDAGDSSMMAVENDDEDDDNSEVNFRDVQRNLKSYSPKKLMSLASALIDAYHSLVEDKDALTLELGEAEQTRDDLIMCVVDLKETICEPEKEKIVLTKKIANIEHERDDLVVVVVDYKETIENFSKEKEALVKRVTEIEEERDDLLGIGFQGEKTPYNPHSKYVTVPDNWLCTHCENNGHFKENCQARVQSIQKNKVFAKNGIVKGSHQQWFMDSGCSKNMTGNTMDFLSLKALQ